MSSFHTDDVLVDPRFGCAPPFTIGVEEELLLVEADTLRLLPSSSTVLRSTQWSNGTASTEIGAAVLELITPVCRTAGEAMASLAGLRLSAAQAGATLMGAGLHPQGEFGDMPHTPSPRYLAVGDELRGVLRRTPHCGVHVHVGMPDAETAVRVCNAMRRWAPLLVALAGNSPYWHGIDSGLASARTAIARSLPRSGAPRAFDDYADYVATAHELLQVTGSTDPTRIWWDIRLNPALGTVELRAMDTQSTLDDLAGLTALVHGLAIHEAHARVHRNPPPEVVDEGTFIAMRDGLAGRLPFDGRLRPTYELARHALRLARPHARDHGFDGELDQVRRLLREGNGADRQRAQFARGGFPAVTSTLVHDTALPPAASRHPRLRAVA